MPSRIVIHHPTHGLEISVKTVDIGLHDGEPDQPPCQWCGGDALIALCDYIQTGFSIDQHQVAMYCPECEEGTVVVFSANIQPVTDDIPF